MSAKRHYILAYRRRRDPPGRLVRVPGRDVFSGTDAQALRRVLELCEVFDRVCWWTWDATRSRLKQRL